MTRLSSPSHASREVINFVGYRCEQCGNKTRFDVFETKSVRAFQHFDLAGEMTVEEEDVLDRRVDRVVCRWCGSTEIVEEAPLSHQGPEGSSG